MTTDAGFLMAFGWGLLSGILLTLMDRIDEHCIVGRYRTRLAYLAAVGAAASMAWSSEQFPVLYSFLFGMCVEWIIKDKIDFPSHVFFLFLLTLYFGWRIDLLWQYAPYIALFLAVRYVSGTFLRSKLGSISGFSRWYYASYWEKFVCSIMLAIALLSLSVMIYAAGFAVASLYAKRLLPGKSGKLDTPCPTR